MYSAAGGMRFRNGQLDEESIHIGREAVKATSDDHPDQAARLNNLGIRLRDRHKRIGTIADLEEAIQMVREAIKTTPEDHPDYAMYLSNLGSSLGDRYSRTGAVADLEESIHIGWEAVKATPEENSHYAMYLNNLGISLRDRHKRTGTMADLEESIQVGREVVKATPEDHPDYAMYLNNLGSRVGNRYSRTGAMADLEESIQVGQEAVRATPEDHPDYAMYLNNLGMRSIQIGRDVVKATPKDHPDYAMYLNNLSMMVGERHKRTGAMADLEESIQIGREAVKAIPENHPDQAGRLNNLGSSLADRYSRTGAMADLEESIYIGREAVKATPDGHPDRAGRLNNLGIMVGDRYSRTGAMADLEESIQMVREAVKTTPEDHPDYAMYLSNLGSRLGDQYSMTGAMADLEESIQLGREAVKATPENHPDQAGRLNNLGICLEDRYKRTGTKTDLYNAISHQESALYHDTAFITTRIIAGQNALQNLATLSHWQHAYNIAVTAVNLIPRLALRSLENSDKQHLLGKVVGFASNAAAAVLNAEKGALVALNLLELGRGVLAASVEEVRSDIQDLQHKYPAQARQRAEASREFDKLIIEIRKQPGFDDFLQAPSEKEMQHAAQKGPIVIINISQYRCDAILVEQDKIHVLPLSNLSSEAIEEKAQSNNLETPRVLEWLWDSIMDPILQALGFTQSPSNCNWPHVWWIPTGPLTKFPLHAAGYHNQGGSKTVLDRVMSSYSLSVKAIVHGRRRPAKQSSSANALLVAMEHTPDHDHLPFAADEVRMLHDMCKSMGLHSIQPKCHKKEVMRHMQKCRIFHFAGHGYTDHADPLQSQLVLDGDSLTVAGLLEINLREHAPFLAYLSACGTGQIKNEKLIDESIHLISAFQLAGFRHVIGTLWSVNDEICVDMARLAYKEMAAGQIDDETVCRGLHYAAREMRNRWLHLSPQSKLQSKPAGKALHHQRNYQTKSVNVEGATTLPRDIIPTDTDTDIDGGRTQALWVPYVHYGV
ncbi:CHAT domain-containing protein [Aspergillus nidulans var. acristatus]